MVFACKARLIQAAPESNPAVRFATSAPVRFVTVSFDATAKRTAAFPAQIGLLPVSVSRIAANSASPRRAQTSRQGWWFDAEGAQRAASSSDITSASDTSRSVKDRGDQRAGNSGATG